VEPFGDPPHLGAWIRSLDLDPLADEWLQTAGGPMKCIAFWHRVAR
jgi:hypothetical protein